MIYKESSKTKTNKKQKQTFFRVDNIKEVTNK
jgi:hypothetical protein